MAARASAMKVTTVRFGEDLWRMLEAEAALAGVSVSQYIREAALARAAAAAAGRGEDPLALLGGGTATATADAPMQRASQGENAATATRRRAAETRSEVRATRAEARQAVRRAHELADQRANVPNRRHARAGASRAQNQSD